MNKVRCEINETLFDIEKYKAIFLQIGPSLNPTSKFQSKQGLSVSQTHHPFIDSTNVTPHSRSDGHTKMAIFKVLEKRSPIQKSLPFVGAILEKLPLYKGAG